MDDEPQGNSPFFWFMLALGIFGAVAFMATCAGAASAQERSPAPDAEQVVMTVWRCGPTMAVRVENRGDTDMTQDGHYLWDGESTPERLPQISAGYSVFLQHPTARGIVLFTYGDGSLPPTPQSARCISLFVPILGGGAQ